MQVRRTSTRPRFIVDGDAILKAGLLGGKDGDAIADRDENGNPVFDTKGKPKMVNTSNYGFERFFDYLADDLQRFSLSPVDTVVVWDGARGKEFRRIWLSTYKGDRDSGSDVFMGELKAARERVQGALRCLGALQAVCHGREADDVIGLLAETMVDRPAIISTVDGDLSVLVNDNTSVWRLGELNANPYGQWPHKYITLYKALVGDTSDKIPGAKGFGPKAWDKLLGLYGLEGLDEVIRLIQTNRLRELVESVAQMPELKRIIDNQDDVQASWRCARLHPDKIHTRDNPLEWTAGRVARRSEVSAYLRVERMSACYASYTLVTRENYARFVQDFQSEVGRGPGFVALDIEAATNEHSDEWADMVREALVQLGRKGAENKEVFDTLGFEITGMSLTYGHNLNRTVYMSINHADTGNISSDTCRRVVEMIPPDNFTVVQNRSFEFSVLKRLWGEAWRNNGWDGFLPNTIDTVIGASYMDENLPNKGLKQCSKRFLGYEQVDYVTTMTRTGPLGTLPSGGKRKGLYAEVAVLTPRTVWGSVTESTDGAGNPMYTAVFENSDPVYVAASSVQETCFYADGHEETGVLGECSHGWDRKELEASVEMFDDTGTKEMRPVYEVDGVYISKTDKRPLEPATPVLETRFYKMNEMPAADVLNYACDDTSCTAGLHLFYQAVMLVERTWQIYLDVETKPEYLTSAAFLQGMQVDLTRLRQLQDADKVEQNKAWKVLRDYLVSKSWVGTVKPTITAPLEVQDFRMVVDVAAPQLEWTTRCRKAGSVLEDWNKFLANPEVPSVDSEVLDYLNTAFALWSEGDHEGAAAGLRTLLDNVWTGDPVINFDSVTQMRKLVYEVMGVTIRVTKALTDVGRKNPKMIKADKEQRRFFAEERGVLTGEDREAILTRASTDSDAIAYALARDTHLSEEVRTALKALQEYKTLHTREKNYYGPYPLHLHWSDGKMHPRLIQCEADTRRYAAREPNILAIPSRGEGLQVRSIFLPHHRKAIFVSNDFNGQELRLMAEESQDPAMLSCYLGEKKKDIHTLLAAEASVHLWGSAVVYEDLVTMRKSADADEAARADALRGSSKTVNFATQYGATAPKVAIKLKVSQAVAQVFVDAKNRTFPGVPAWSERFANECEMRGYATTRLGARRHFAGALARGDRAELNKMGRQGPNYRIQGSGAEQLKLAMCGLYDAGVYRKYDAQFVAPIHDEVVSSVAVRDCVAFIIEKHAIMTRQYAGMKIPAVSEVSIGVDLTCPVTISGDPTPEKVIAALKKLGVYHLLDEAT